MNEHKCSKAERDFLNAIKKHIKSPEQIACPFCDYDGLGPQTPELEQSFRALAKENGRAGHE